MCIPMFKAAFFIKLQTKNNTNTYEWISKTNVEYPNNGILIQQSKAMNY